MEEKPGSKQIMERKGGGPQPDQNKNKNKGNLGRESRPGDVPHEGLGAAALCDWDQGAHVAATLLCRPPGPRSTDSPRAEQHWTGSRPAMQGGLLVPFHSQAQQTREPKEYTDLGKTKSRLNPLPKYLRNKGPLDARLASLVTSGSS